MNSDIEEKILMHTKKFIDPAFLDSVSLFIKKSNTPSISFLSVKANPSPWRSDVSEKTFAKIKLGKKSSYIAFKNTYKKDFDNTHIPYVMVKSEQLIRVTLEDFFNIDEQSMKKIANSVFFNSFNFASFGCCGKFKECQEKGLCVHPDIVYANAACQLKKHIEK